MQIEDTPPDLETVPDRVKADYEDALGAIIHECIWGENGRFAILLVGDPNTSFINVLSINSDRDQALVLLHLANDAMVTKPKDYGDLN